MTIIGWILVLVPLLGSVLLSEERLSLTKLAKEADVNVSTVWRWAQRGVKGVRLETFCVGGRRYTTREAWDRFVARTTEIATGEPMPVRQSDQMEREIAEAEAFLEQEGV